MPLEAPPMLKFEEVEEIAANIAPRWTGITGLAETPTVEAIADLFLHFQRRYRQAIAAREEGL